MSNFRQNKTGVPISTYAKYLGNPTCDYMTNMGKNCRNSLIYTNNGEKINCTKYCLQNCDKWVNDMLDMKNIPTHAIFTDIKNNEMKYKIDSINIIFEFDSKDNKDYGSGTVSVIDGKILLKNNKTQKIYDKNNVGDAFCYFIKNFNDKNYNKFKIQIFINNVKDDLRFIKFDNNIRMFRQSNYWIYKTIPGYNNDHYKDKKDSKDEDDYLPSYISPSGKFNGLIELNIDF